MKAPIVVLCLALTVHAPGIPQLAVVEKAVASALSWHYRWIERIPRDLVSLECSLALFDEQSFAYCEPVRLSFDIETGQKPPQVTNIFQEHWDFEKALADFRAHRNPKGRPAAPVHRFSIPVGDLHACEVDRGRSAHASTTALPQQQRAKLAHEGRTLRYPVVCDGDPFYLVYFMRGERVEYIWRFELRPDRLDLTWSYDSDNQRRPVPGVALENLKKPELWYIQH